MLKQTRHQVVRIAVGTAILWAGFAGSASADVSANGIRLTNGVSVNGIRLTNGVHTNGIRLRNGPGISGQPADRGQDPATTPALRPSRLCSIEPELCGVQDPQSQPSGVDVRFVTLPDGKTHALE